jgi:hypothetical protein
MFDRFEARRLPATFLVANLADGGAGSLRQALLDADADASPGANVVDFAVAGTIRLTSGPLPVVTDAVQVDGSTAPGFRLTFSASTMTGTLVSGRVSGVPNADYAIDLFLSPGGRAKGQAQGATFLASVTITTDASGVQSFTFVGPQAVAGVYTATATDPLGNTSEFSEGRYAGPDDRSGPAPTIPPSI